MRKEITRKACERHKKEWRKGLISFSSLRRSRSLSLSSLLCRPLQLSSRFFSAKRLRRRNKSPVPSKLARGPGRKGRAFRGPSSFRSSLSPSSVLAKSTTPSLTGNAMIYTHNQHSFLFPSRGSQARWGESPHHISPALALPLFAALDLVLFPFLSPHSVPWLSLQPLIKLPLLPPASPFAIVPSEGHGPTQRSPSAAIPTSQDLDRQPSRGPSASFYPQRTRQQRGRPRTYFSPCTRADRARREGESGKRSLPSSPPLAVPNPKDPGTRASRGERGKVPSPAELASEPKPPQGRRVVGRRGKRARKRRRSLLLRPLSSKKADPSNACVREFPLPSLLVIPTPLLAVVIRHRLYQQHSEGERGGEGEEDDEDRERRRRRRKRTLISVN